MLTQPYSCVWELVCLQLELFAYSWSAFAYNGNVHLINTSTNTVSKKTSPINKDSLTETPFEGLQMRFLIEDGFFNLVPDVSGCRRKARD